MERIKEGYYVKTYELNTGEIAIGRIDNIFSKNKEIYCWRGIDELCYEEKEDFIRILPNTIIWDKSNRRYVFAYRESMMEGYACFSTIVIECSPYLETLLVNDEKVKYRFR